MLQSLVHRMQDSSYLTKSREGREAQTTIRGPVARVHVHILNLVILVLS